MKSHYFTVIFNLDPNPGKEYVFCVYILYILLYSDSQGSWSVWATTAAYGCGDRRSIWLW